MSAHVLEEGKCELITRAGSHAAMEGKFADMSTEWDFVLERFPGFLFNERVTSRLRIHLSRKTEVGSSTASEIFQQICIQNI